MAREQLRRPEQGAPSRVLARLRAVPVRHEPHQSGAKPPAGRGQEVRRQLPKLLAPVGGRRILREREQGREAAHPRVPAARPRDGLVLRYRRQRPEARRSVGAHQPSRSLGTGALRRDDRPRVAAHARDGRRDGRAAHGRRDEGRGHERRVHRLLVDALPRGRAPIRSCAREQARRRGVRPRDLAGPARRGRGRRAAGARARRGRGEEASGEGSREAVEEVGSDEEAKGEARWTSSRSGCWSGSRWIC